MIANLPKGVLRIPLGGVSGVVLFIIIDEQLQKHRACYFLIWALLVCYYFIPNFWYELRHIAVLFSSVQHKYSVIAVWVIKLVSLSTTNQRKRFEAHR